MGLSLGGQCEGSGDPHHVPVVLAQPPPRGEASPWVTGTSLHPQTQLFGELPQTSSKIHQTQSKQALRPHEKYINPKFLPIQLQDKVRVGQAGEAGGFSWHAILAPVRPLQDERGQARAWQATVAFRRRVPRPPGPAEHFWAIWRGS